MGINNASHLQSIPRGRIFRFHYLFPITLKREKNSSTWFRVDPGSSLENILDGELRVATLEFENVCRNRNVAI